MTERAVGPKPVPEDLWRIWCTSVVRIDLPGRSVRITGAEPTGPAAHRPGVWVVLTAWNPWGLVRAESANRVAGRHLLTALRAAGTTWHPAVGASPDGSWEEEGVAVDVVDRYAGMELARRWEQLAVYEWDPDAGLLSVVACFEDRVTTMRAVVDERPALNLPPPPP